MNIIDLSHRLDGNTPVWPGDIPLSLEQLKTVERDKYTAFSLNTGLHTGTHIDLPMHLVADGRFVCDFAPAFFIGEGLLLDARGENPLRMKPEYRALPLEGRIVLLWTGFGERFDEPEYFTDYPTVSEELAQFLLDGGVKMLGTDTPAPDKMPFPIHKLLLGKGIFILENLTRLQELHGIEKFTVIALPLKIAAEASLVRAVALL